MKRRTFIAGLGSAAAWPLAARAQQPERMRRVGVLMNGDATGAEYQSYLAAFIQGLRQLGWTDGQNFHIDVRWNASNAVLAQTYAAELAGLMPDVIVAASTVNLIPVVQIARTVPIVFVGVADPVAQGFVASVGRPGGNLTGFSQFEFSLGGKWLDLLKQAAPSLTRVAVMFNPDTGPYSKFFMPVIEADAVSLHVQAMAAPVRDTADIEPALESFARQPNGGLMLLSDSFVVSRQSLIADLAGRYRLPSIAAALNFAKSGGLMDYRPTNLAAQFHKAATYVDLVLKGSKPADLPVQAPTQYGLTINLKTAKALGLTIPETLLATADEVIQ
jgi:putative ABC transport system substrate-binding protein